MIWKEKEDRKKLPHCASGSIILFPLLPLQEYLRDWQMLALHHVRRTRSFAVRAQCNRCGQLWLIFVHTQFRFSLFTIQLSAFARGSTIPRVLCQHGMIWGPCILMATDVFSVSVLNPMISIFIWSQFELRFFSLSPCWWENCQKLLEGWGWVQAEHVSARLSYRWAVWSRHL